MPRSLKKFSKHCGVALILLVVLAITYYVGREHERGIAFIETNRAYFEHRGDGDLVDQYAYPDPFLAKYIEKHGLTTRQEIDAIMQGYVRTWSVKDPDGSIMDIYEFNLGNIVPLPMNKKIIEMNYDPTGKFVDMNESGGSVFLRR